MLFLSHIQNAFPQTQALFHAFYHVLRPPSVVVNFEALKAPSAAQTSTDYYLKVDCPTQRARE